MSKFWNFALLDNEVTLRIDGDIVDDSDVWIYEWLDMQSASPNAFRNDLAKYKGKNINLWIDSYGGSVFAATGIYNALMEHKNTGGKIISIADGKVMSAALMPFMAGDERLMTPSSMLMAHNPLTNAGGYASDLRKAADILDEVKECIINAYELATGLDRGELSKMMDNETYMSAKTAVDCGFATGIKYAPDEGQSKKDNIMNFSFNRLAIQNAANDSMKKFFELAQKNSADQVKEPVANINPEKTERAEEEMEFKNAQELQMAYPDFVNQLTDEAVKNAVEAERNRIRDIEAISNVMNADLVNKAKFKEPMTAEKLAFENAVLQAKQGKEYLSNAKTDFQNSGVDQVKATPNNPENNEQSNSDLRKEQIANSMVEYANKLRGGK